VHPILFRILCSFLDQGIAISKFPVPHKSFLESIRAIEGNSFSSFFKTKKNKRTICKRQFYNCGVVAFAGGES
jgi:hypothetical protein